MPKTPSRKKSRFDVASIAVLFLPVAFLLGIGAGYLLWGAGLGSGSKAAGGSFNPVGDDPAFGPKDAPITIVEFSDYQCPYCESWHAEVYHRLISEYGDKIQFVYRDFPLTQIHPGAQPAAEAANCALEQDKYWEYHDGIFSGNYDLTRDGLLKIATDLGLNAQSFAECIDSNKYAEEVQTDLQDGISLGVQSTPTFFINGFQVVGAQPYENFKSVIDQILAGDK